MKQDDTVETVLRQYGNMIYRLAYARVQNVHDAQDITQDVFLKYIRTNKHFRDESHRKAWLLRVTINTSNTFLQSAWNRHRADLCEATEIPTTQTESRDLKEAIASLPESYRVVIHLYYYEFMSVKEIGTLLHLSESAVKSRLFRARELLRTQWKEEGAYEF